MASVFCCVRSGSTKVVKLGAPRTTSAAAPLAVGNAVVDQDAVILRVGDIKLAVLNPDALRSAHGLRSRRVCRGADAGEIRLPDDDVGGLVIDVGNRVPDQNAVVVGIRHHQVDAVGSHGGGEPERAACRGKIERRRGEIGLSEDNRRFADADRAFPVVSQFGRRARELRRGVLKQQDAMIRGAGADTIGVGDKQGVSGECNSADAPTMMSLEFVSWLVKVRLADNQSGGLPGSQVGALGKKGRRAKNENRRCTSCAMV